MIWKVQEYAMKPHKILLSLSCQISEPNSFDNVDPKDSRSSFKAMAGKEHKNYNMLVEDSRRNM